MIATLKKRVDVHGNPRNFYSRGSQSILGLKKFSFRMFSKQSVAVRD